MSLNQEVNKLVDLGMPLADILDMVNKAAISRAVFKNYGNQTAAAKMLQTHRSTVRKFLDPDTAPRRGSHYAEA